MSVAPQFRAELLRALQAGARGVLIVTDEETRALDVLEELGRELDWPVHTWSAGSGIDGAGAARPLAEVLDGIRSQRDEALWVLLDTAGALDAAAMRRVREIAQRVHGPALVLLERSSAAAVRIPELLRLELPAPDAAELAARVQAIAGALQASGWPEATTRMGAMTDAIVHAAAGLPSFAFERLLAEAVLTHGLEPEALVGHIHAAKPRVIGDGLLEPVAARPADALGGLDGLKAWLALRRLTFSREAALAGLAPSRGCLLIGVQGCGKSLAARVCATTLGLPLLRLEPGRLFGGTVGESEANLRRALADVSRIAPVVLWIDELDKGFAGAEGGASDAGTAARVLGGLLTWLQERTRPVFVVATANRVDLLPAELLRRGRFDEIFFIDLPDADTREAIAQVHWLGRTAATALGEPWSAFAAIARAADGYSGAELEAAVAEARLLAFARGRAPLAEDFAAALAASIPLSVLRAEDVAALRRWAHGRARPA